MSASGSRPQRSDWRTSLVGRDRDVAAVKQLLISPESALVTLTGPGGIGKTRLALRVVEDVRSSFPGGVTVSPLGAIRDPSLVLQTIVQAFNLEMGGDVADLNRLTLALGGERHLLFIDNFEHLTGEAPLISMIIAACQSLTVLVTSRAALRLSVEREYPVAPLSLTQKRDGLTAAEAESSGAIQLFVQRARAVKPDFQMTDENAPIIADVVARLDGLPLAIELAAVRSKVLAPKALRTRLVQSLTLLTGGARDMPERLRTMRDAIAWSHELLDTEEQTLFRRLGVFNGSFSLEAAEAVAGAISGGETVRGKGGKENDSSPAHPLTPSAPLTPLEDVLDGIASLVDKSLLVHELADDGDSRYRLLETIREFALEQLGASGEDRAVRLRLVEWAIALAAEARPHLYGSVDQQLWLQMLTHERDAFRGALGWAFEQSELALAARLAGELWGYWFSTDNVREGSIWIEQALLHVDEYDTSTRSLILTGSGFLGLVRLEFDHSRRSFERLLEMATGLDDQTYIGWAQFGLGVIAQDIGNPGLAQQRFEGAREAWRTLTSRPALAATATQNLGLVISRQGDHERGAALIEEALTDFKRIGFDLGVALASRFLGQVMRTMGNDVRAVPLLLASLQVKRTITQQWHIANALEALASIAAGRGQERLATTLFGAIDVFREQSAAPLEPALQPEHIEIVANLRNRIGEQAFTELWAAGRGMPIEQAISEAAGVDPGTKPSEHTLTKADEYGLTPREIEVLKLLVTGLSTGDIAEALYISPRTVSTHIASILGKLGVSTRSAAVALTLRSGVLL